MTQLQFDLSGDDQALFLAEVDELLQKVEEALVDLERAPDDQALLQEIFRAAHTIKGSSATIGHTRMASLTHAMETRLDDVRKGTAPVTPELIEALLGALDVLKLLRDEVETRRPVDVDVEAAVSAVERRASLRLAAPAPASQPVRAPAPDETEQLATLMPTYRFTIALEPSPWSAVRALQVLLALGEHGRVLSSLPSQAEIEREDAQVEGELQVVVESTEPAAALLEALSQVPELASVASETLSSPDATPAEAADEPQPQPAATPSTPAASQPGRTTTETQPATTETQPATTDTRPAASDPGSATSQTHPAISQTRAAPETSAATDPRPAATQAHPAKADARQATTDARPAASASSSSKTIRIDVARLDALLNLVGELVIDRTRLVQLQGLLTDQFGDSGVVADLQQTAMHIGRITDELQEQVMKSRMLPVESVFNRLPRVVRDVSAKQGKQIDFIIEGKDTELDRSVIEEIGDPLLHLIRNAVDHGLETPEERAAAGKPVAGQLRLTARHADSFILISLEDDGRGINVEAVKRKAVERGVITQDQADRMADHEAVQLIFAPGLSTAKVVSDLSGRGVGMDVVRANVEKINGSVDVTTRPGHGTTFTIRLPLTLAIVQALLVRVAGGIYALPIHSVTETLRVEEDQIHRINHREAMQLRGTVLPLVSLRTVFGLEAEAPEDVDIGGGSHQRLVVAVHTNNARQVGLIVDGLVGEQEIVIKPLGQLVGDVAGLSGAAILGDGSVALILDVSALMARAIRDNTTTAPEREAANPATARSLKQARQGRTHDTVDAA